jgi:predicted transcriptional regulator
MTHEATFTLTLDPDLRDRFIAEADATMRQPEDVVRDLMRDFVALKQKTRMAEVEAEIAQAIREADDPVTRRVSHREALSRLDNQRAELISRAGQRAQ